MTVPTQGNQFIICWTPRETDLSCFQLFPTCWSHLQLFIFVKLDATVQKSNFLCNRPWFQTIVAGRNEKKEKTKTKQQTKVFKMD